MAKKAKVVKHPLLRTLTWAVCIVVLLVFAVNVLLNTFTRHNQYFIVPDFAGMNSEQAQWAAQSGKLQLEITDSLYVPAYEGGVVLEQRPEGGSKVKSGRRVFLTVNSYNQRRVKVPFVAGYSLRQAKNNLELSGLVIKELIYRDDLATNNVLEQYYGDEQITMNSNLELEYGSAITLVVGRADNAIPQNMPKLIGLSTRDAKSRLWELGLNVGRVTMDLGVNLLNQADAKVYVQGVEHALPVSLGDKIDLSLTMDSEKVTRYNFMADSLYKERLRLEKLMQDRLDSLHSEMLEPVDTLMQSATEDKIMQELINFFD